MSPYIEELDISIQWKQEPPAKPETPVSQKLEAPVLQSLNEPPASKLELPNKMLEGPASVLEAPASQSQWLQHCKAGASYFAKLELPVLPESHVTTD
jgi:hypothetical protein